MKIFVSYSRRDAGDFAEQIQKNFSSEHDVFTDVNSINAGDIWSSTIENNISNCDIFVAIVTYGALQSPHVENELLQAQREKKRIIPCFHRNVREDDIQWGLNKIQGIEFNNEYDLARSLHSRITRIERDSHKKASVIFESSSKQASEVNGNSDKYEEVQQPKKETPSQYTSSPTYKRGSSSEKRPLQKNLKLLVPIVVGVAVVGSILGFVVFGGGAPKSDEVPSSPTSEANNNPPEADPTLTTQATPTPPPNAPLEVNAGPDQTVNGGEWVILDGNASDPDGGPLNYSWTQTGGDPTVILSNADSRTATFRAPSVSLAISAPGGRVPNFLSPDALSPDGRSLSSLEDLLASKISELKFNFTVTDSNNAVGSDDVIVTVNAPTPTPALEEKPSSEVPGVEEKAAEVPQAAPQTLDPLDPLSESSCDPDNLLCPPEKLGEDPLLPLLPPDKGLQNNNNSNLSMGTRIDV